MKLLLAIVASLLLASAFTWVAMTLTDGDEQ